MARRFILFFFVLCVLTAVFSWRPLLRIVYPFPYSDIVHEAAEEFNLDPLLLAAMMRAESGYNEHAISPRGARGLMQVMPDTAEWIAEQMQWNEYDMYRIDDPYINIRLAAWYIQYLSRMFEHNTPVVIAAYNAGPGNVGRWIAQDIWTGDVENIEDIPFLETRQYVRRVRDGYTMYRRLYSSPHQGYEQLQQGFIPVEPESVLEINAMTAAL